MKSFKVKKTKIIYGHKFPYCIYWNGTCLLKHTYLRKVK